MLVGKLARLSGIVLLACLLYACNSKESSPSVCEEAGLGVYADSLDQLLLSTQVIEITQISEQLVREHKDLDCPEMVRIKSTTAYAYELQYNYETALSIYTDLLPTVIDQQDHAAEISIRIALARVYECVSRPMLCVEQLDLAKTLMDKHGLYDELARYHVRYASYVRVSLDNKELVIEHATKAVAVAKEQGRVESEIGGNLILGLVTEDIDESMKFTQRAIDQFFELGDYTGGMYQQVNLANRYVRRGDLEEALEMASTINHNIEKVSDNPKIYFELKKRVAGIKTKIFEQEGEKDSLIAALKSYNENSELLGDRINQQKISQLLVENSVNQEKEKTALAIKQNKLLIGGLTLLMIVIIFLTRLYFLNKKRREKIEEQKATIRKQFDELEQLYNYKTTLLSEVHHRIKNNLQLIISLLMLQKAKIGEKFDHEILDMLSFRIKSISLIHEQLYSLKEFEKVSVNLYLEGLVDKFRLLIQERNIHIVMKTEGFQFNLETITPLGLIWSELISNSLKYNSNSKSLTIHFNLVREGEFYKMYYRDNGIGYPNDQFTASESGMGFTIIHSLSRQLAATTNAYNSNGANFELVFKEKTISPI